jgi:hypothetical protein
MNRFSSRITNFITCGFAAVVFLSGVSNARAQRPELPLASIDADPAIPTLVQIVGHRWGDDISSHAEIERYCHALAKAAPDRCRLVKYGETYQGRNLYYFIVTSAANLKRIDEIREKNLGLADPRVTVPQVAKEIAANAPAVVWFANCVHGAEVSPSDAAILTAYHLLADRRPETRELLEKIVVIIDPLQNPDGRDRFVNHHRDGRGAFDQESFLASERQERWPGGRFNHYLFDMNRDWFLQSQKETQARVAAFLKWKPQIFVDAHEMGPDSHYYFDPATDPYNAQTLPRQREWHTKIGKLQAAAFDRQGIPYTTREMFDSFGPQYGSTWPMFHGAIAILWEQAGSRGKVVSRDDATKLHYRDGVRNHYISALATMDAAAKYREKLLLDFYANNADSVKLGETGPVKAFYLLEGKRPARTAALAQLLKNNGIEVSRLTATANATASEIVSGKSQSHSLPAGTYVIPLNQPASRLAQTLLERHQDMGAEFVKRQEARTKRGLPDEIYDATSWSLPIAFDVTCLAATTPASGPVEKLTNVPQIGRVVGSKAKVAYLIAGDDDAALASLCRFHDKNLRVHVMSEPVKVNGQSFPRGSLVLRVSDNPVSLHDAVAEVARSCGAVVHAIDTGFVDGGASFGGPHVHHARPPRTLLLIDRPANNGVGHAWYLFDRVWNTPVTRVVARLLPEVNLDKFDVLVLPNGNYKSDAPSEDMVRRLKDWIHGGGTLILVGGAAEWATGKKVKLLASEVEKRAAESISADKDKADDKSPKKEKRPPLAVPGAFLRAAVDTDHFLTWGLDEESILHMSGDRIFTPLQPADGKNLITFSKKDDLLASGYCWPQTLKQIAGKPYLMYQPLGRGHIVAFADDPTYRAFSPQTQRLFFNAVFFSTPRIREQPIYDE